MFKSPTGKLIQFFRKSRDGWKTKCQQMRLQNKLLKNQTRAVEKSRDHWKQIARSAQRELRELKRTLDAPKNTSGR